MGIGHAIRTGSFAKPCPGWDMTVVSLATGHATVVEFKGSHSEREIILWGVRRYVAYPISSC